MTHYRKRMRRRLIVWVMIVLPCVFSGVMIVRSGTRREIATWSSARRVTGEGTHAYGIYAISEGGLLWLGIESVTWFGPGGLSRKSPRRG